jgi:integrase/recombinase XerD
MTKQTTPLRQRMIEDMTIRNMSPSTQKIYVAAVANFSIFHGRSPDKLTFEDVRDYRLHLISRGLKPNSINPIMGALRFFYRTTMGLKEVSEQIPYARRADPLPAVLARDEVERLLRAVTDFQMRTAFITIYAAGLRVSEVVKLTGRDIDSARMVIVIRQSKGRKDRYVMLSEQLLGIIGRGPVVGRETIDTLLTLLASPARKDLRSHTQSSVRWCATRSLADNDGPTAAACVR